MRTSGLLLFSAASLVLLAAMAGADEEKAYRSVSTEKLEGILKEMKIKYKKSEGKSEGIYFYDYERNKFKIRLHNYNGKDLWIDALFTDKSSLAEINVWNKRTKFSRAVLLKNGERETISLESQIDCLGGVTDTIIRQFINRFDGEINGFVKFLVKGQE
jgi:hypothetical protein